MDFILKGVGGVRVHLHVSTLECQCGVMYLRRLYMYIKLVTHFALIIIIAPAKNVKLEWVVGL